jgi:predicted phage tail protein
MNRPAPPLATDLPEALATDTQRDPNAWLLYWHNINQYIQELEANLSTAHAEVQSKEQAAQAAQTSIAERNGIIQYQREQLAANQKQITQLEVEKAQLIAATTGPTANTPQVNTTPISSTAAKAHADEVVRSAMPATALPSGNLSLSEKIPDPKEFDGTRGDLCRFIQQIHGKMTANADRFSTATACLTYVAGRLTGRAYELILPKTVLGIPQFTNYPELLEYLEKAFGDPDRMQNAQNKLFSLKQKAQDFSVYFSEFQRLALEGEMPESALTPLLFQGISCKL